jgi:hypothetical protein
VSGKTDRDFNEAAEFLPYGPGPDADGGGEELPAIRIGGARVFAYLKGGVLRVSVDLDEVDGLTGDGECVPVKICVGDFVVFETDAAGVETVGPRRLVSR